MKGINMVAVYYDCTAIDSLLLALTYLFIWHKHFDIHITLLFLLVPVNNIGYLLYAHSKTVEEIIMAIKVTYIGGCFNILMIMLTVFSLCDIQLPKWLKLMFAAITSGVFISALSIGSSDIFYKDITAEFSNGEIIVNKVYGPLHSVFYGMVFLYFALSIAAMVYSYFKKNQVSRHMLYLLFLPEFISFFSFFGGRKLFPNIELIPAAYDISLITYLIIIYNLSIYDINETAIDSLAQTGDTGFVSFDFKLNYLGSNDTAKKIIPQLNDLTVDKPVSTSSEMGKTLIRWLKDYENSENNDQTYYKANDKTYVVDINYLYSGKRRRGYQLFFKDDTKNQQYNALINRYNTYLRKEVAAKTAHIIEMHDNLVMSMATMVESRDNSTGGHIKRTSEVVRMLVDEINKDDSLILTPDFCKNIIKAAPMHDLGKIAVDDAILRKPGRFTAEEFEVMKTHAAEGARIVHEILKGTDDMEFHLIAENVAHYHHERWDGSGYPEGLKGEEIPIEARIMAIADVYDALVSKRVYKERMSFEEADAIILEGMGKHFDKNLEKFYIAARPGLEAYYRGLEEQE